MAKSWREEIEADLSCVDPEPRWPIVVAIVVIVAVFYALPQYLAPMGPPWLLAAIVIPLLIPASVAHWIQMHDWNRRLGLVILGLITTFLLVSVMSLVRTLVDPAAMAHRFLTPQTLLHGAVLLWTSNILIFALWYWRLDAGGPHARDMRPRHESGAFMFPQMTMSDEMRERTGMANWSPGFVDYLFLAFNTSTALSPADTSALSRWAKVMMMIQSTISLTIIVFLAARAVNILT